MIFTDNEIINMRKLVESIIKTNSLIAYSMGNSNFNIDTYEVVEYVKAWIIDYKNKNNIDIMSDDDFINISRNCINDFTVRVI